MAKETAKNLPKSQVVKLESYPEVMERFQLLAKKYANLVVTKETYKESLKARAELREERYLIQNIIKNNKGVLNEAKKKMESDGAALIDVVLPVENEIDTRLKAVEAEKAEEKRLAEVAKQKLAAERMEKISKLQTGFMSEIIEASTIPQLDVLNEKLSAFEVTDKEFGDLKLSCEQTIAGISFYINQAKERIEKEIEAEKQLRLSETKRDYKLESGEEWYGEDDIDQIQQKIAAVINTKAKAKVIDEYHDLGGEVDIHDEMTLDELIGHVSTLKFELAEFAKKKKLEEKQAKKARVKLAFDRMYIFNNAGISDSEWIGSMLGNDYPGKMIEGLTDAEFTTFKDNLIAIDAEITKVDFEEIPIEHAPIKSFGRTPKKIKPKEFEISITGTREATIHYVATNEEELNSYTRHSATNWTVTMGESEEQVYDCEELEALFQGYIKTK